MANSQQHARQADRGLPTRAAPATGVFQPASILPAPEGTVTSGPDRQQFTFSDSTI
jgi:hypothetical protein